MRAEPIYQALFDLTANLAWSPSGALAFSARRVKTFEDLPAQPALCQAETDETITQVTSQNAIATLGANWLIYHQAGRTTTPSRHRPPTPSWTRSRRCSSTRPIPTSPRPSAASSTNAGSRAASRSSRATSTARP
jgi:hypothetical protein